jgi:hypothetical protein
MKILVCGGREFADKEFLYFFLDDLLAAEEKPVTHVIHGNARGADKLAHGWAVLNGIQPVACDAIWTVGGIYNPQAGLVRNQRMLDLNPDLVVAFPGERGTAHMVRIAKAKKVRVMEAPR